jgi:hypothetical protein
MTRRSGMRTGPDGPGRFSLPSVTSSLRGRARALEGRRGRPAAPFSGPVGRPPDLPPAAARALLRVLRAVAESNARRASRVA